MKINELNNVKKLKWIQNHKINNFRYTNVPIIQCPYCNEDFCDVLANHTIYKFCPSCGKEVEGDI